MRTIREYHYDDRMVTCYRDRPKSIYELFANTVRRCPNAVAFVDGDRRSTYYELSGRVASLAGGLALRGVSVGDRVAMLLYNRTELFEVFLACMKLGAVAVPMNVRQRRPETQYMLADCGAVALVTERDLLPEIPSGPEVPDLRVLLIVGGAESGFESLEFCAEPSLVQEPTAVVEDAPACILYTSGTSGRPKGALLTHFSIIHSCLHAKDVLGLGDNECAVLAVPASHVTGLVAVTLPMLMLGGRVVLMRAFKAADYLKLAAEERITFTVLVPAMYNLCLLQPEFADHDLSSWRVAGFGGAPMPRATVSRLSSSLPNLQLANLYGATETTGAAVILPLGRIADKPTAVGIALPCCEIVVMASDVRQANPDEVGEVWIAGATVVPAYWNNPTGTKAAFAAGYWKSGDLGSMDSEGFLSIHDRKKDMINRGGFKVYSAEVEQVVGQLEGVIEVAIVGRPCSVLGERSHMFIVGAQGETTESVRAYCATRLSDYKVPDFVTFLSNPLPRNANGKIIKSQLQEESLALFEVA